MCQPTQELILVVGFRPIQDALESFEMPDCGTFPTIAAEALKFRDAPVNDRLRQLS